jgi:hypothetical protein
MSAPAKRAGPVVKDSALPVEEVRDVDSALDKALAIGWEGLGSHAAEGDTLVATAESIMAGANKLQALQALVAGAIERCGVAADCGHHNTTALLRTLAPNRHPGASAREARQGRPG